MPTASSLEKHQMQDQWISQRMDRRWEHAQVFFVVNGEEPRKGWDWIKKWVGMAFYSNTLVLFISDRLSLPLHLIILSKTLSFSPPLL